MRLKQIAYCFFILALYFNSYSQIPDIRFEKYTVANGLTQNSTGSLLQDSRGFLWIGTSWGLNRYDGRVVKQFNQVDENHLPDLSITSLAEDKEGFIWIGTSNGLSRLDPLTEKFTNYIPGNKPGNIPDGFCTVYIDKEDNVWIGCSENLCLFDRTANNFQRFTINTFGKDIRVNRYISDFLEDRRGRFWISTSYGIKLFDRSAKTYHSYHFEETKGQNTAINATQGLFEDKDGNIWAGTWNGGVLKYDSTNNKFVDYLFLTNDMSLQTVHNIQSLVLNDHYYLLLTTEGGLLLIDPSKTTKGKLPLEKLFSEPTDPNTVLLKNKWEILKDRQNNYWISGASGLLKIDWSNQSFQWRSIPGKDFTSSVIYHVIPAKKNAQQKVFLTTKQGWWQYDLVSKTFTRHSLPKGFEGLLSNINRFISVENGYWFTSQDGFGFYNTSTNSVIDLSAQVKTKKNNESRTGVIAMDDMGRVWFSVFRTGIGVYDPKTGIFLSLFANGSKEDLTGKSIFDMKRSPDGKILFTNGYNLFVVNPQDFSYSKIDLPSSNGSESIERTGPRDIFFDDHGRCLVLSWQRIYQFQNNRLEQLYPLKGFSGFNMQDILQDSNGSFWISTSLGLYKTDPGFSQWVNMSDKIPAGDFADLSEIFRSDQDEFILTSTGRIGTFSLHELDQNKTPPVAIVNRLRIGDKEQYLIPIDHQWEVSFKDAVEIELSAINFLNEKGNKIFYQLSGRDDDWKELTGTPIIRYEQLPPGSYELKIKAQNTDGVSSIESTLSFKILPPFWRTWWFISLSVLALFGILFFFYRYRVRQLIREERLRAHIATDLHDDIGATLSSISFYSETIRLQTEHHIPQLTPLLEKMGETSREMVSNMSDIVWMINPENDSFEKMLSRMQNLAVELCAIKNIQLHFAADERLDHLQLSMEQRRNIFLIFKEALNNALKYSQCRNIKIELRREDHSFFLRVADDGKGFSEETQTGNSHGGNGLRNMRSRAKEINGKLEIQRQDKGTSVLLTANIT